MGLFQRIECSLFYHVKSSYRYITISCRVIHQTSTISGRLIAAGQANLQLAASMQPTSQPPCWESYLQRLLGKFSDQKVAVSGSDLEPKRTLNSDRISSPKCSSFRMLSPSGSEISVRNYLPSGRRTQAARNQSPHTSEHIT